eukprot:239615_1
MKYITLLIALLCDLGQSTWCLPTHVCQFQAISTPQFGSKESWKYECDGTAYTTHYWNYTSHCTGTPTSIENGRTAFGGIHDGTNVMDDCSDQCGDYILIPFSIHSASDCSDSQLGFGLMMQSIGCGNELDGSGSVTGACDQTQYEITQYDGNDCSGNEVNYKLAATVNGICEAQNNLYYYWDIQNCFMNGDGIIPTPNPSAEPTRQPTEPPTVATNHAPTSAPNAPQNPSGVKSVTYSAIISIAISVAISFMQ